MEAAVYNTDTKKKDVLSNETDATKLELYTCISGTCTQVEGFAKKDNDYYLISTKSTDNKKLSDEANASLLVDCSASANVGSLITDTYKLCIGVGESVNFPGSGADAHYLISDGTDYYFVRALPNILIKTKVTKADGANVINIDTGTLVALASTNADAITKDISSLAVYNCDTTTTNTCKQTYGYIKSSDSNYFSIGTSTDSNAAVVEVQCSKESDIGGLKSGGKLCLDGTELGDLPASGSAVNYLLSIPSDNTGVFKDSKGKSIIVTAATTSFTYNNLYTEVGVNLFEKNKVIAAADITTANKLALYNCAEDGICEQVEEGYAATSSKYYKISEEGSQEITSTLETTCKENVGKLMTGGKFCINENDSDVIPIDSSDPVYAIIYQGEAFKFVSVNAGVIAILGEVSNIADGPNVINISTAQKFTVPSSAEDTNGAVTNLILFNCNKTDHVCKQTVGYIKDSETSANYYSISADPNDNAQISSTISNAECSATAIGTITKDGYCLNYDSAATVASFGTAGTYILGDSVASTSVFTGMDKSIVKVTTNGIYQDNLYSDKGINLFKDSAKASVTDVNKTDKAKIALYSCTSEGTCTEVIGFVKNTDYFYINTADTTENEKIADKSTNKPFKTDCSVKDNIGSLISTGKLCIGVGESVDFVGSEETDYFVIYDGGESTAKFVRAIENIFTIEDFGT
eukprot:jgi/Orpsp1_1/1181152/evm.model.c7180000076107.1